MYLHVNKKSDDDDDDDDDEDDDEPPIRKHSYLSHGYLRGSASML